MPRVYQRTKSARGAERKCGRCGKTIMPGEPYFTWEFRYGGARFRCGKHRPRPSELTQSKMSAVYAATEDATDQLPGVETLEDLQEVVTNVAEAVREVAEEYREADEAFGGQGATESAERADELEGWADELEMWEPDTGLTQNDNREAASEVLGGCPL